MDLCIVDTSNRIFFLIGVVLGEMGASLITSGLLLWSLLIPSIVYLRLIRNQYKTTFPDSKFLNSNRKQALFCITVTIFAVLYWAILLGIE